MNYDESRIVAHTANFCALCGAEMNIIVNHPYDDEPYNDDTIENVSSLEFPEYCAVCAVTRRAEVTK